MIDPKHIHHFPGYIYHDIEQNSPEWFYRRKGCFTASKAKEIAGSQEKGLGKTFRKLITRVWFSKHHAQYIEEKSYSNESMEHGINTEDEAVLEYEKLNNVKTENGGLCISKTVPYAGASPDGLIVKDGKLIKILEVKCLQPPNHLFIKSTGIKKSGFYYQIQFQLMVTCAPSCDVFLYCPMVKDEYNNHIYQENVPRDEKLISKFIRLLNEAKTIIDKPKWEDFKPKEKEDKSL